MPDKITKDGKVGDHVMGCGQAKQQRGDSLYFRFSGSLSVSTTSSTHNVYWYMQSCDSPGLSMCSLYWEGSRKSSRVRK